MSEQGPINEVIKIPDSMEKYDMNGNPKPETGFSSGESGSDRTKVPVDSKVVPVERPVVQLSDEQAVSLNKSSLRGIAGRSGAQELDVQKAYEAAKRAVENDQV